MLVKQLRHVTFQQAKSWQWTSLMYTGDLTVPKQKNAGILLW
jgi:hypothetical protein